MSTFMKTKNKIYNIVKRKIDMQTFKDYLKNTRIYSIRETSN